MSENCVKPWLEMTHFRLEDKEEIFKYLIKIMIMRRLPILNKKFTKKESGTNFTL